MKDSKESRYNLIGSFLVFCISMFVYIYTLCPTVYWEDSAELSAALGILGLPHSPSFPLYVLSGYLFSHIPIGNIAFLSNLFSAILASLSLLFLYYLILNFLRNLRDEKRSGLIENLVAFSSTLVMAFTFAFWINAIRAEVYALNALLLILLIWLLVKWGKTGNDRLLFLFFFVYGLSFGNHSLLMFLCGPAFLYFLLINHRWDLFNLRKILMCLSLFVLGLSIYLFLPFRSMQDPLMDWGNPQNLSNFIEAFTRKTSLSSGGFELTGIPYVFASLIHQFTPYVFWLGILGFWVFLKKSGRYAIFSIILLGTNMLYVALTGAYKIVNYDGQGYLIVSYLVYSIWTAMAMGWILHQVKGLSQMPVLRLLIPVAMSILLILPVISLKKHFWDCNKRGGYQAHAYGCSLLSGVDDNALVLVNNASPMFILWYLKYVEQQGKMIKVIDRKTLKRESYRLHVAGEYPEINFPSGKFDLPQLSQTGYSDSLKKMTASYIKKLVDDNKDDFPIYWESGADDSLVEEYLTPKGMLFKVEPEKVEELTKEMLQVHNEFMERLHVKAMSDPVYFNELKTKEFYTFTLNNLASYFYRKGWLDDAIYHYTFSLRLDPQSSSALNNLSVCLAKKNRIDEAVVFLKEAIHIDPNNLDAHNNLGLCFYKLGQPERAKYHWEKALKLDKDNSAVIGNLRRLKEPKHN